VPQREGQEVDTSDLTSGEVWRLRGVIGVTRPPSTPKDGAITTQDRLHNMTDYGTDIETIVVMELQRPSCRFS